MAKISIIGAGSSIIHAQPVQRHPAQPRAQRVSMVEQAPEELAFSGDSLMLSVAPYEIVTLKLWLGDEAA